MHPADEHIKRLKEFTASKEGKEWIKEYFQNIKDQEIRKERYLDKIHSLYGGNTDILLEKLMGKYYTDEYANREHKLGYEPREPLLWLMFEYAIKYGKQCNDKRYYKMFTGAVYYLGSYVLELMVGQGSSLLINKRKGKKYGN